jgi:hypothetical protein
MSGHPLDDLPALRDFRDQLTALAHSEAEAPPRRRRLRAHAPHRRLSLVLAAALAILVAGSAAAAMLAGLRATVIPGPRAGDVAPPETIIASTARVLDDVRAKDPDGRTVWTLRAARTHAGETCLTVGQNRPGGFGLVGLDGRFRLLAPSFADACGQTLYGVGPDSMGLVGARTLAATRRTDVRTVIYGMADGLTKVIISVAGRPARTVTPSRDHAFAFALAGYPEDHPVRVRLIRKEQIDLSRTFGTSSRLVTSTGALPALKLDNFVVDSAPHTGCVSVTAARHVQGAGSGPTICGPTKPAKPFGAVRAVRPGKHKSYNWGSFPARTLAVGSWPRGLGKLRSVVLHTPTGTVKAKVLDAGHSFLGVLPARTNPRDVTVTMTPEHGAPVTFRGSLNLVPNPMTR